MKAFIQEKYGLPEVLEMKAIEQPTPKDNEVRIKVKAISLNPAEWHLLNASIWMVRLSTGFLKPKHPILGADIAGCVESVGKNVTAFKVGDNILGRNINGGLAEYACLEADKAVLMPEHISFEMAAAVPLASITALIALRDKGHIQSGQKVLINGASGGIGTFAVQLAKHFGGHITAVCSGKNFGLVQSLGAEKMIDYTQEDFTKNNEQYDLIIDLIGNRSVADLSKVLTPEGKCVVVGFTNASKMIGLMLKGGWKSATSKQKFIVMDAVLKKEDLEFIAQLVSDGNIKPVIDKTYPFGEMRKAFEHLGTRRAKGKIVIKL